MKFLHRVIAAGCLGLAAAFGVSTAGSSPALHEVPIDCSVRSSNDGCETVVSCPSRTKIRTVRAACNLEHGSVTVEQVASVEQGYMEVVRPSDHVEEGRCWVGGIQLGSGHAATTSSAGLTRVTVGCQEHDQNGGDCHIRGLLYCD
jgi:hypothetical protein